MTEVGLSISDIGKIPIGLAISMLMDKRQQEWEKFKIEEIRLRRLAFYSSMWLDHKGKSANDLYPLPWEGEEKVKLDKDTAAMAALELQKRLSGNKPRKKKNDGFKKMFGR